MSKQIIDPISGQHISISHLVAGVHAGALFTAIKDFNAVSGVVLIKTHADNYLHLMYGVESQDAGVLEFFEAPTVTVPGTLLNQYNHKRTNTDTLGALVYHTPTTTDDGTRLNVNIVGSGGALPFSVGGEGGINNKFILKPDTYYLIKYTPAAAAIFAIFADMHEADTNPDS